MIGNYIYVPEDWITFMMGSYSTVDTEYQFRYYTYLDKCYISEDFLYYFPNKLLPLGAPIEELNSDTLILHYE